MKDKNFQITVAADGTVTRRGQLGNAHIHALRQNRCDLKVQAGTVLDAARGANRKLTPAENAVVDTITHELDGLDQALVLAEREQDLERTHGTAGGAEAGIVRPAAGRKFAQMFPHVALDRGGFHSSEEFLATIHSGLADPRLMATNTNAVPSDGGFSVPSQIFADWLDTSLEQSGIVRPRADVRPMAGSEAKAVGWDDGDHTSDVFGGFTGQWVTEAGDITVETPTLRLISLKARKLAILARVSNELVADGQGFDAQLGAAIPKALGWFLDRAFLTGNGAAEPLGILNASCTITVAKEGGQAAGSLLYPNLANMFARLTPGSHERAVWVANATLIPYLLQLGIPVGTGGSWVPVLSESGGKWTMLTRPVIFTEKVATAGTVGDIMLLDLSQYVVGLRSDFTLAKSQHAGFASDTAYYRGTIRVDGQPKLSAAITPYKGTTVSPFVVLQTRA